MSVPPLKLVAFDMDGVLLDYRSSWTWVHDHFGIDNRATVDAWASGEIDEMEFMRRDICAWIRKHPRVSRADIGRILDGIPVRNGIRRTVDALHAAGIKVVIVSGGIDIIAAKIALDNGFDGYAANGLACDESGCLTGEGLLNVEIQNKRTALERFMEDYQVGQDEVASIGDSFIDIAMFNVSRIGIAFNPTDEEVVKSADVVIRSDDLTSVLETLIGPGRVARPAGRT
ncbi:MAG: HAD-IB family phosphatase [Methanomassiliicoccales archaeon]